MVLSSTTLQTLVTSYLAERKTERYYADEGLGCFESAKLPEADSGLEEYNSFRLGDERIQTQRLLDDDDEGSEISNDPAQISAECEAALKTIVWNKTLWQTRVICPRDILNRVMGRERVFIDELTSAYPGLRIQPNHTARTMKSDLANPVDSSKGSSKLDEIRLSSGACVLEMTHDDDKVQLAKAKVEMEDRVSQFRRYAAYTHFLSLPILDRDNISFPNRHAKFCELLDECEFINLDSEIAQPAGRSHVTLLMLRLYSEEDIAAVIKVLKKVAAKPSSHHILFTNEIPEEKPDGVQLPPKGFNIKLKGIFEMDEDPAECRVLFTKEDETLQTIPLTLENQKRLLSASTKYDEWLRLIRRPAETYLDSLIEDLASEMLLAGLIDAEELVKDRLVNSDGSIKRKLHVTIINGKFRKNYQTFDARPLLNHERLKNFDFGTAVITGLHISRRGQASPGTHYYEPEFILPIRPNLGL